MQRRWLLLLVATAVVSVCLVATTAASFSTVVQKAPSLGANLIFYDPVLPECWGGHVPIDYDHPGVRERVVPALHATRAAGVETFRLWLPFSHETDGNWPINSAEGRLVEPYRTNLVRLLDDIRKAGFEQVTIGFVAWGANDPMGWFPHGSTYDPALFGENWGFIRDVRTLAKRHGPPSMRFDLMNEGAPGNWDLAHQPFWGSYVIQMYRNYVDAYGYKDVTISAVAKGMENLGNTGDDAERMQNLIDVLRASGKPLPTWFDVHTSWNAGALADLRAVDRVLTRNGLSQPLVIGEERYNNHPVASAIAAFARTSKRRVREVMEWPEYLPDTPFPQPPQKQPRCAHLPYRIDEYAKALLGAVPPRKLRGWVGPKGQLSLVTPYGDSVRALAEGNYTITIRDASTNHGFRLAGRPVRGACINRSTGVRFKGTVTWKVGLRFGSYTYASRGRHGTVKAFSVLVPG